MSYYLPSAPLVEDMMELWKLNSGSKGPICSLVLHCAPMFETLLSYCPFKVRNAQFKRKLNINHLLYWTSCSSVMASSFKPWPTCCADNAIQRINR